MHLIGLPGNCYQQGPQSAPGNEVVTPRRTGRESPHCSGAYLPGDVVVSSGEVMLALLFAATAAALRTASAHFFGGEDRHPQMSMHPLLVANRANIVCLTILKPDFDWHTRYVLKFVFAFRVDGGIGPVVWRPPTGKHDLLNRMQRPQCKIAKEGQGAQQCLGRCSNYAESAGCSGSVSEGNVSRL